MERKTRGYNRETTNQPLCLAVFMIWKNDECFQNQGETFTCKRDRHDELADLLFSATSVESVKRLAFQKRRKRCRQKVCRSPKFNLGWSCDTYRSLLTCRLSVLHESEKDKQIQLDQVLS